MYKTLGEWIDTIKKEEQTGGKDPEDYFKSSYGLNSKELETLYTRDLPIHIAGPTLKLMRQRKEEQDKASLQAVPAKVEEPDIPVPTSVGLPAESSPTQTEVTEPDTPQPKFTVTPTSIAKRAARAPGFLAGGLSGGPQTALGGAQKGLKALGVPVEKAQALPVVGKLLKRSESFVDKMGTSLVDMEDEMRKQLGESTYANFAKDTADNLTGIAGMLSNFLPVLPTEEGTTTWEEFKKGFSSGEELALGGPAAINLLWQAIKNPEVARTKPLTYALMFGDLAHKGVISGKALVDTRFRKVLKTADEVKDALDKQKQKGLSDITGLAVEGKTIQKPISGAVGKIVEKGKAAIEGIKREISDPYYSTSPYQPDIRAAARAPGELKASALTQAQELVEKGKATKVTPAKASKVELPKQREYSPVLETFEDASVDTLLDAAKKVLEKDEAKQKAVFDAIPSEKEFKYIPSDDAIAIAYNYLEGILSQLETTERTSIAATVIEDFSNGKDPSLWLKEKLGLPVEPEYSVQKNVVSGAKGLEILPQESVPRKSTSTSVAKVVAEAKPFTILRESPTEIYPAALSEPTFRQTITDRLAARYNITDKATLKALDAELARISEAGELKPVDLLIEDKTITYPEIQDTIAGELKNLPDQQSFIDRLRNKPSKETVEGAALTRPLVGTKAPEAAAASQKALAESKKAKGYYEEDVETPKLAEYDAKTTLLGNDLGRNLVADVLENGQLTKFPATDANLKAVSASIKARADAITQELKPQYPWVTPEHVSRIGKYVEQLKPGPAETEFGGVAVPKEIMDTVGEVQRIREAAKHPETFVTELLSSLKVNLTARAISALTNNVGSNTIVQAIRRADPALFTKMIDSLEKFVKNQGTPQEQALWKAIKENGDLDSNVIVGELGGIERPSPKNVVLRGIDTALRPLENLYQWSDQVFKLEDIVNEFKKLEETIKDFTPGQWVELEVSPGETVVVTRTGNGWALVDPKQARVFKLSNVKDPFVMKEFKVVDLTSEQFMRIKAKAAAQPGLGMFVDYTTVPRFVERLRSMRGTAVVTPFLTWFYKTMDIPGLKKGMIQRTLTNEGAVRSTNSPEAMKRMAVDAAKTGLRRGVLLAGAQEQNDPIAQLIREAIQWDPTGIGAAVVMGTAGSTLYTKDITSMNPFGPSLLAIRAIYALLNRAGVGTAGEDIQRGDEALVAGTEQDFNKVFPPLSEIEKLPPEERREALIRREYWIRKSSDRDFTWEDGLKLVGFAGTPLSDFVYALKDASKQGVGLDKQKVFSLGMSALLGGTPARAIDVGVGLATGGKGGLASAFTTRDESRSIDPNSDKEFLDFAVRRLTGIGLDSTLGFSLDKKKFKLQGALDKYAGFLKRELNANILRPLKKRVDAAQAMGDLKEVEKLSAEHEIYKAIIDTAVDEELGLKKKRLEALMLKGSK